MSFLFEVLDGYDSAVCQRKHRSSCYPDREIDGLVFYLKFGLETTFRQIVKKLSAQCYRFFFSLHFHLKMNNEHTNHTENQST